MHPEQVGVGQRAMPDRGLVNASAPVARAAQMVLAQCVEFVRQVPQPVYVAEAQTIQGGTVGKHVRHTIDHFAAALPAGEEWASRPIDYDHRSRGVPMETERSCAIGIIGGLCERLAGLSERDLSRPVRVRVMLASDGAEAELTSTLGRELAFATHHAVHHFAMMKTIAAEFGILASEEFGLAPSTLHSQRGPGETAGSRGER